MLMVKLNISKSNWETPWSYQTLSLNKKQAWRENMTKRWACAGSTSEHAQAAHLSRRREHHWVRLQVESIIQPIATPVPSKEKKNKQINKHAWFEFRQPVLLKGLLRFNVQVNCAGHCLTWLSAHNPTVSSLCPMALAFMPFTHFVLLTSYQPFKVHCR